MKFIIGGAILGYFLLPITLLAQRSIEKTANYQSSQAIQIELNYASKIIIKATDQAQVSLKSTVDINDNQHNDNYELKLEEEGQKILIKSNILNIEDIVQKKIRVSSSENTRVINYGNSWYSQDGIRVSSGKEITVEIVHEIQVPRNAKLKLKTVGGDIQSDYIQGELAFKTGNGNIDLKVPTSANRTFTIKSRSDVYSDLDIQFPELSDKGLGRVGGGGRYEDPIDGKLNQGGKVIRLSTFGGNIFLRKE